MDNNKSEGNLSPEAAEKIAKSIAAPFIGPPQTADDAIAQQILSRETSIRKAVVAKMEAHREMLYFNKHAFGQLCAKEYLEHYRTWPKEEVVYLLVKHFAEATVEHMQ